MEADCLVWMLQATHLLDDPVKLVGQSKTFVTKKKVWFSQNENNQAGQLVTQEHVALYPNHHWCGLPIIHQTNSEVKYSRETFRIVWFDFSSLNWPLNSSSFIFVAPFSFLTLSNHSLIAIPNSSHRGCDRRRYAKALSYTGSYD